MGYLGYVLWPHEESSDACNVSTVYELGRLGCEHLGCVLLLGYRAIQRLGLGVSERQPPVDGMKTDTPKYP